MNNIKESIKLWERGIKLMPRGTQTMSKSPNQYVFGVHPMYLDEGDGCRVKDVDGNWYIDHPCALGPIILGYNHKRTIDAVESQLRKGITFSLMSPLEVELAEILTEVIPCAEQVRYAKNGSDVTSIAVRVARSYTGKESILTPNGHYHGWHDFFAAVVRPHGVPECLKDLVEHFEYNDSNSLEEKLKLRKFAAVIMEPVSLEEPKNGFLEEVRRLCTKYNTVLIFDEMITGFRWALGGAQEYYNVTPDLATFGKAIANGMPLSVLAGKTEFMKELDHVFFSSTFGGEACSIAAAIATVNEMIESDGEIFRHIWEQGGRVRNAFNEYAANIGVDCKMIGCAPRHNIVFNHNDASGLKDIFHQETIRNGVLIGTQIYTTWAHKSEDIGVTIGAMIKGLDAVKIAIDSGDIDACIDGDRSDAIFKRDATKK